MVTVSYTRRPAIRADRDCTFVAGDADMVFGEKFFGRLIYFENLGSTLSPVFVQKSGDDNPFDGIDVGSFSEPALADLDNDGDLDLVAGDGDGMLHFLENTGTSTAPVFVQRTGSSNPFDDIDVGSATTPPRNRSSSRRTAPSIYPPLRPAYSVTPAPGAHLRRDN